MIATVRLRKGPPSMAWLFGALGAVAVGLVAANVLTPDPVDHAGELERYGAALAPPVRDAGRAIVRGIRPDITEFQQGRISPAVWQRDMVARSAEFSAAWRTIAALDRPDAVAPAHEHFDEAFRTYLLAARVLFEAGGREGDERAALIEWGAEIGDAGDDSFDRGAAVVQRARRANGLPPDLNLPNPNPDPRT